MRHARIALAALSLVFVVTDAAPARAEGWLEFFFPSLRQPKYDPAQTMQAPFALTEEEAKKQFELQTNPNAPKQVAPKYAMPENNTPLDQPHRDNQEISDWLTNVLSQTLTFDAGAYEVSLKEDEQYFTPAGLEQYKKFLNDNNVVKVLESNKFDVRSFVQDLPLLLNEGAVNGSYRWLYEVPVMVSYMDRGAKDYKNLEPVNQQLVLTVQIGRVAGEKEGMAVRIERWDGKAQRVVKK